MDLFYFWNQNLAFTATQTSIPCYRATGEEGDQTLESSKTQAVKQLFLVRKMHLGQLS
jgi:hypothetical protein